MRFGIIGLGRIGGALARQALEKGRQVVGYNRGPKSTRTLATDGLEPAWSVIRGLVGRTDGARPARTESRKDLAVMSRTRAK
jgi:6-phosphogluconate dehydrogenase (decarboxylating)